MLGQKLEYVFNVAIKVANEKKHEFITLENILLAMLQYDSEVIDVLRKCGANIDELRDGLQQYITDDSNFSILSDEEIKTLYDLQFETEELKKIAKLNGIMYRPELSLALQRVIQRAAMHIQAAEKDRIQGINVLIAIYAERESYAVYLLEKQNISRLSIVELVAHSLDKPITSFDYGFENESSAEGERGARGERGDRGERDRRSSKSEMGSGSASSGSSSSKSADGSTKTKTDCVQVLNEFAINLNQLARQEKLEPLVGRKEEIARIIQILCRKNKNNPLLVGDSGVGKTALAHGLVLAIENGEVPELLRTTKVYALDLGSVIAGTKFRGDFEERLKLVLKGLVEENKSGGSILFIDEIHTIMGAGATTGGSMDVSNLLKPVLASGDVKCMGSTTYDEFRKFMEKDQALIRRFQKVDIREPSVADTIKIIEGIKDRFEKHHKVYYSKPIIELAVNLASKHISDKKLPDKAIDVIDESGSYVQIKRGVSKEKDVVNDGGKSKRKRSNVTVNDIEEIVASLARIPKKSLSSNEKEKLKNLEDMLKHVIFGQDVAIDKVVNAIQLSRSGLTSVGKPVASFLFAGPTGVGKTELAKQLSLVLSVHFERFDMSEFMEKHSVSKLIGAPPGYVGFDQGGKLTDAINKHPYCVLLLDEIEKAHQDVFNILLQVMDHGTLADSTGKSIDFRNVIIIMTTNIGSQEMEAGSIGFGLSKNQSSELRSSKLLNSFDTNTDPDTNTDTNTNIDIDVEQIEHIEHKRDKALKNFFTPEFRNRLDAIVHFNRLSTKNIENIVDKFLNELKFQLKDKKVELELTKEAKLWLVKNGYDTRLGARPIGRLIDEKIKKVLSKEILFGKLQHGGSVSIILKENNLDFDYK
ncbi:MAG: AAA family ATPase [Oligoflexia bacterium]|nr:AAA family ATPase [Oligoflexia bacterium]